MIKYDMIDALQVIWKRQIPGKVGRPCGVSDDDVVYIGLRRASKIASLQDVFASQLSTQDGSVPYPGLVNLVRIVTIPWNPWWSTKMEMLWSPLDYRCLVAPCQ